MTKKYNKAVVIQSEPCPVKASSLIETVERVKKDCGFEDACAMLANCTYDNRRFLENLCWIIARVRRTFDNSQIQIGGEFMRASEVKDVFSRIGADELSQVLLEFQKIKYPIKYISAYLRTMLYNAAIETPAKVTNEVNVFMKEEYGVDD